MKKFKLKKIAFSISDFRFYSIKNPIDIFIFGSSKYSTRGVANNLILKQIFDLTNSTKNSASWILSTMIKDDCQKKQANEKV